MGEKLLYHYTAVLRWNQIKESGYLKLTPSNLLKPKNPHYIKQEDGTLCYADETDSYKPVVWLTSSESPQNHSIGFMKEAIQIAIPYDEEKHQWWVTWKDKNRMDKSWCKKLISNGQNYSSWYVCEEIIPMEKFAYVKNLLTGEIIYKNEQ